MKRTVAAVIATAFVLLAGIVALATPAGAHDPCIATCVDGFRYICCPETVLVNPNCKGPKCKTEQVWECWYEFDPSCMPVYP